ncbi:unnamed protein product [Anisakis simplex]|uniref:Uncharacterized protein n=1 Tax=Anisakis simplex TaxID=6269 RepID=A0A3P6NGI8_ANISI|nr:unnamed protein product [Anisakis simplex]
MGGGGGGVRGEVEVGVGVEGVERVAVDGQADRAGGTWMGNAAFGNSMFMRSENDLAEVCAANGFTLATSPLIYSEPALTDFLNLDLERSQQQIPHRLFAISDPALPHVCLFYFYYYLLLLFIVYYY